MPTTTEDFILKVSEEDPWETYKLLKRYRGLYRERDLMITEERTRDGLGTITDFYVRKGARQKARLTVMFGSYMEFTPIPKRGHKQGKTQKAKRKDLHA